MNFTSIQGWNQDCISVRQYCDDFFFILMVVCENCDHCYPVRFYTFFFTGLAGIFGVYRSSWRFCVVTSLSLSLSSLFFICFFWFTYKFFLSFNLLIYLSFSVTSLPFLPLSRLFCSSFIFL